LNNPPSRSEIKRILSRKDNAMLCREFLKVLNEIAGDNNNWVQLHDVIDKMTLRAYNLEFVIPLIIDDYLVPNQLLEQDNDRVRITFHGRKTLEQINRPGVLLEDIMNIIESTGGKTENFADIVGAVREIAFQLQEIYRPRVFFNIVPDGKVNRLYVVLRNSGRSPAYNIGCIFDPDLPYYVKHPGSSRPITFHHFKGPFTEEECTSGMRFPVSMFFPVLILFNCFEPIDLIIRSSKKSIEAYMDKYAYFSHIYTHPFTHVHNESQLFRS
jgi:hypothetical protein